MESPDVVALAALALLLVTGLAAGLVVWVCGVTSVVVSQIAPDRDAP